VSQPTKSRSDGVALAPALYDATVTHVRREGVASRFRHGTFCWLVDLDALPALPRVLRPLARFEARDHLGDPKASIRTNVEAFCAERGVELSGGRVLMLANARSLGYCFNPISLFWCHDADGALAAVIAEVHNTYGDRHAYLLRPDEDDRDEVDKQMYVSPFHDVSGRYRIRAPQPGDKLGVSVVLERDGHPPFSAGITGRRLPVTPGSLLALSLRYPWAPLRVSALIRAQAIKLWARGLKVQERPEHPPQTGVQPSSYDAHRDSDEHAGASL
jgi:DUF1365 family protein